LTSLANGSAIWFFLIPSISEGADGPQVLLTATARDFSRKYMEAEQKKYELGNSTIFFVLQAQGALVTAESSVVQNSVGYRRNLMNLLLRTGDLLEARGIAVR
jgi:outer membrane protein TolC